MLQSLRSLAEGWRLGPDHGCTDRSSRCRSADDRYICRANPSAWSLCRGQQTTVHGPVTRRADKQDSRCRRRQWLARTIGATFGARCSAPCPTRRHRNPQTISEKQGGQRRIRAVPAARLTRIAALDGPCPPYTAQPLTSPARISRPSPSAGCANGRRGRSGPFR
jgi:hypothetical protein